MTLHLLTLKARGMKGCCIGHPFHQQTPALRWWFPSSAGSRSADVVGVSWGTAILVVGEAGGWVEGGFGSDMFHHFKITCTLLEGWTRLLCGVVCGMGERPSPLTEGFILWDVVVYVDPLDHAVDGLLQLRLLKTASGNGKDSVQKCWVHMKSNPGLAEVSLLLSNT